MDIELISKVTLITLFSLFSAIRIEYYRRARKAGYRTVIEERMRYAVWLSLLICYEVFTFFIYILFPEMLAWATLPLPLWVRLFGACVGFLSLLLFVWVHQALGDNFSIRVRIKESQYLITSGPYRWVRHPMYSAFYLLHIAAFLITANWFIGVTWLAGLTAIILLRVSREEAMLVTRFGQEYRTYSETTGRFFPKINGLKAEFKRKCWIKRP